MISDMREIPALKVRQWLFEWDEVPVDALAMRRQPPRHFYLFSMPARDLRALSGIQRRSTVGRQIGSIDTGIQRHHEKRRSSEIRDYMHFGFPYAGFSPQDREKFADADSKMPGWLPTAIVVNIFDPEFSDVDRKGRCVAEGDHIRIQDGDGPYAALRLPNGFKHSAWKPKSLSPIVVIDGQHRLWAVDDADDLEGYELPVVAFKGLDLSWQAYLFYTINIRPKKINTSLAFDLYPLLRTEKWLAQQEDGGAPRVYRETRAQEIVQSLYVHPESPWHRHINMLGKPGQRMVRQSAWIRSLLATYIKPMSERRNAIGGLFSQDRDWHGAQQVAFIIYWGRMLRDQIENLQESWAEAIREAEGGRLLTSGPDPAFYGKYSLLNTDQGIRGFLSITNDLSVLGMEELRLREWVTDEFGSPDDQSAITVAIKSLSLHCQDSWIDEWITQLATFDWRTSATPGLDDRERTMKQTFRGSGGYREIRRRLLLHLASSDSHASIYAENALRHLGFRRD